MDTIWTPNSYISLTYRSLVTLFRFPILNICFISSVCYFEIWRFFLDFLFLFFIYIWADLETNIVKWCPFFSKILYLTKSTRTFNYSDIIENYSWKTIVYDYINRKIPKPDFSLALLPRNNMFMKFIWKWTPTDTNGHQLTKVCFYVELIRALKNIMS